MKISTVLFFVLIGFLISCTSDAERKISMNFIIKDSCEISVSKLSIYDTLTNSNRSYSDSILNITIKFKMLSLEDSASTVSKKIFSLNRSFSLNDRGVFYLPVFVQPIATGNTNEYTFIVAFELPSSIKNTEKGTLILMIENTPFFKNSVTFNI